MKSFAIVCLFILSVLGARSFLYNKKVPIPKFNYLSCHGEVDELNVSYRGEYYLVKSALPKDVPGGLFWAGAWRTNSFAFENTLKNSPSLAKSIAMGKRELNVVSTEEAFYPQDINQISERPKHFFPEHDADYVKNLFDLKAIKKGEPAIKVTYEANQTLYTCHGHGTKFNPEELKFYIPNDPYMAFDFYPSDKFPPLKLLHDKAIVRTHPCYELDMIREQSLPKALGFGFGWNPLLEGHDNNKESFSCPSYYKVGENISQITPVITKNSPAAVSSLDYGRFKNLDRPIRASFFFGAADNYKFSKLDPEEAKSYVDKFLSDLSGNEARKVLSVSINKYDKTFSRLLVFLKNMKSHITTHSYDVMATSEVLQIKFKGKFNLSKKDIEIFVLFSPNLPTSSSYELFAYTFASKFLSSDIVVYDGHTAGGKTLEYGLEVARKSIERTPATTFPPYQILSVLSCSANGVFHVSRIPKVKGIERDIVYGLSTFSDAPANGALSFIVAADKYLYNKSVPHFGHWASYFRTDNHLLLVNQRD